MSKNDIKHVLRLLEQFCEHLVPPVYTIEQRQQQGFGMQFLVAAAPLSHVQGTMEGREGGRKMEGKEACLPPAEKKPAKAGKYSLLQNPAKLKEALDSFSSALIQVKIFFSFFLFPALFFLSSGHQVAQLGVEGREGKRKNKQLPPPTKGLGKKN